MTPSPSLLWIVFLIASICEQCLAFSRMDAIYRLYERERALRKSYKRAGVYSDRGGGPMTLKDMYTQRDTVDTGPYGIEGPMNQQRAQSEQGDGGEKQPAAKEKDGDAADADGEKDGESKKQRL